MVTLKCDICGGTLIMKPGATAKCSGCGMDYSTQMLSEKYAAQNAMHIDDSGAVENCDLEEPDDTVESSENTDEIIEEIVEGCAKQTEQQSVILESDNVIPSNEISDEDTYHSSECRMKMIEEDTSVSSIVQPNKSNDAYRKILLGVMCFALIISIGVIAFVAVHKNKKSTDFENDTQKVENASNKTDDIGEKSTFSTDVGAKRLEILDSTLQGNYTNWGSACYDLENVYFTDFLNGIYCSEIGSFLENESNSLVVSGFYSDLGIIGDYIYAIKTEGEDTYVVRINKHSYHEEVVSSRYVNTSIIGQDIVDETFYYVVGSDRLYYIKNEGGECSTPYRNVLKMSKYGVFTTSNQEYGLEYTSFRDESSVITYEEFSEKQCGVQFFDEKTAIICDYTDGLHDVYILDLDTKNVTPLFRDIIEPISNIISVSVNATENKYILSITYQDDLGKSVSEIHSYSKSTKKVERVFSKQFDEFMIFSASSVLMDEVLFTSFPISGTGYFFINKIE